MELRITIASSTKNSFLFFFNMYFYFLTAPSLSCSMWDLVPPPGIELRPPALGEQSISHSTTREVPKSGVLFFFPWLHWVFLSSQAQLPCSMWDLSSASLTRDQTHIPCTGRWILNHWTTREVPPAYFLTDFLIPAFSRRAFPAAFAFSFSSFFCFSLTFWPCRIFVAVLWLSWRGGHFCSCRTWTQLPRGMRDPGSPTRNRTPVPCFARQILNHWTTRELPLCCFFCFCLNAPSSSSSLVCFRCFLPPLQPAYCPFPDPATRSKAPTPPSTCVLPVQVHFLINCGI